MTVQTTRHCVACRTRQPYNQEAERSSKASGFRNNKCWKCYVTKQRKAEMESAMGPRGVGLDLMSHLNKAWR
jgi:hypothetical protein